MNKLIDALRALTNEKISTELAALLASAEKNSAIAKLIENGANRTDFLEVDGVSDDAYNELRALLNKRSIDRDTIVVAKRGRLGGLTLVRRSPAPQVPEQEVREEGVEQQAKEILTEELSLESSYYSLVETWAKEAGYDNCQTVGGKLPGFKWENPDLVSIDYEISRRSRSIRFYVVSFEVKLRVEPYAVWQAAHYQRFSNEAYIAFARDENEVRSKDDGRVFKLAVDLGLGILCFERGEKSFREIQSPRIIRPDPSRIEETIENFSEKFNELLSRASREHGECFRIGIV